MLFNSFQFLIFFPIVVFLYFLMPFRYRWIWLLLTSYYFYMCWRPEYIILIILSTIIDYYAGIQMGKCPTTKGRMKYLILSLFVNLGLLFSFKYFNFFNESYRSVFNYFNLTYPVPQLNVLLPVGISFYTFQTLSYTIDVFRGIKKPEKHLGIFALYVAFFPQLVAGPIERSTHLLKQFFEEHHFDYDRVVSGLRLLLIGFFKKVVIADQLALYVNEVYNNPGNYQGTPLILATYFFAIQIYCDFSGYSDIAIGCARVMGYDLMQNFRTPYYAQSIREFWQRWHISLTTWFKDYLYIPLGGNRTSKSRWYTNLFIVFLVSGLWHGANWTFIVWGALHGFYLLFSLWTKKTREKIIQYSKLDKYPLVLRLVRTFITFHLVWFSWVFFRANSLPEAFRILQKMFIIDWTRLGINILGFSKIKWLSILLSILIMETIHMIIKNTKSKKAFFQKPIWLRWSVYYFVIFYIIFFGQYETQDFVYFQF